MLHRKLTGFLACIFVLSLATGALAGVPDPDESFAEVDPGAVGAAVWNLPNFQGNGFDAGGDGAGSVVDATITLHLRDINGDPVIGYPFEDLWLESSGGGLVACSNGTTADFSTDASGDTEWTNPMGAGGHSEGETVNVLIAGTALNHPGLNVIFNSADISGDLAVNLTDVTLFSTDYAAQTGDFRSDFVYDGAINLSDVTLMARGNGTSCP